MLLHGVVLRHGESLTSYFSRDHQEYQGVGGWIILGWIVERWDGVMWTGLVWLRIGTGGELL
jgi:hypothetical protein